MQYTDKYQFKLIEGSDPFLPEALNDNARKLEHALEEHEAAVERRMDSRAGMVTGSYVGTGEYGKDKFVTIEVPDAERPPQMVIVMGDSMARIVLIRGMTGMVTMSGGGTYYYISATWTDTGVKWYSTQSDSTSLNEKGKTYYYAAFF